MLYSMLSRRQSGVEVTVVSGEPSRELRISLDTLCSCVIKDRVSVKREGLFLLSQVPHSKGDLDHGEDSEARIDVMGS